MKRVLILAYDFPPYVSVGGLRPYSWYKYFHEFGIYPIVVTRQWSNIYGNHFDYIAPGMSDIPIINDSPTGKIIYTPYKPSLANRIMLKHGENKYKYFRKILSSWYEFFQWVFLFGPKSELYKAANNFLKVEKVDLLIATGDPFVLFRYASLLSKKHRVPWVADYRDLWCFFYEKKNPFLFKWYMYLEKKYIKTAIKIVTVSEYLKFKINKLNKRPLDIEIVPNGFDPDIMEEAKKIDPPTNYLSIAYIGTIYKWHPVESFLYTISTILNEKKDIQIYINFYGVNIENELKELIANKYKNLNQFVFFHKKIQNKELVKEIAKNNIMLTFNHYSLMGTKIYDYLGVGRQILMCYSDDKDALTLKSKYFPFFDCPSFSEKLQEDLIMQTNSGYIIKDEKDLFFKINEIYEAILNCNKLTCNSTNVENYSRRSLAKKYTDIIKSI